MASKRTEPREAPRAGRLNQLLTYGRRVFALAQRLSRVRDRRRKPVTGPAAIAAVVFYAGLLRVRSFNALEPMLAERPFLRLLGRRTQRLCCVDTVSRALRVMDLVSVRGVAAGILKQAERNKVFREGWHGALRYVAIDGWETASSRHRHCPECLTRKVKVAGEDGPTTVTEYYHRYVVAMLIGPKLDLALDIEPLRPKDLRPPRVPKAGKARGQVLPRRQDEGELTVGMRLLRRVKASFPWLDVVVADSLYANGPFLQLANKLRMSAVVVARKESDEPLRGALRRWSAHPQHEVVEDEEKRERIAIWDAVGLETLSTYDGPIRVVRAQISRRACPDKAPSTWCVLATGRASRILNARKIVEVARARWHIENTGFHQWTTCWHFDHVFLHHGTGLQALYLLFFAAYDLLTLWMHRQHPEYGRFASDVTRTITRLIEEMRADLVRLDMAVDTS